MIVIRSRANPVFKHVRALAGSAQRQRKEGVALLEGAHLAKAYLDAHHAATPPLQACIVSETAAARAEIADLLTALSRLFAASSGTSSGASHGGHDDDGAVVAKGITCFDDALFEQLAPASQGGIGIMLLAPVPDIGLPLTVDASCIVLDGVQDAGNAGSILRSAAAAGIRQAFCMPGTANAWSNKVLRAAMGAHFELSIVENVDLDALVQRLAVPVAITDSHGAVSLYESDLSGAIAWVFGNEGAGVSAGWRAHATHRVTIPQPGRIESLNVAAAAAVCLFEQCRQQAIRPVTRPTAR